MARRRAGGTDTVAPPFEDIEFFLLIGPLNHGPREFTDAQGAAGWAAHGPRLMDGWTGGALPGSGPYGFWQYEVGEEPAKWEDGVVLLAERGELSEAEITALAERRTWTDINDGTKHTDEAAVEL